MSELHDWIVTYQICKPSSEFNGKVYYSEIKSASVGDALVASYVPPNFPTDLEVFAVSEVTIIGIVRKDKVITCAIQGIESVGNNSAVYDIMFERNRPNNYAATDTKPDDSGICFMTMATPIEFVTLKSVITPYGASFTEWPK